MLRIRTLSFLVFAILMIGICFLEQDIFAQSAPATAILSGTVKSSDGKPLEGVGVSARNAGETFTTTVYTDQSGRYFFPPVSSGQYKVWAQAVGFETATSGNRIRGRRQEASGFDASDARRFPQTTVRDRMGFQPAGGHSERQANEIGIHQ